MEEIRKIPSPLQNPQPVGNGSPNRPDEKTGDEFKEVLRRRRDRQDESESDAEPDRETGAGKSEEARLEESQLSQDDERGVLLDERA